MHMSDALLSPSVGTGFWLGSAAAVAVSSRRVTREESENRIPLMGVMGAFIFSAQMVNFTLPGTGSSGHLGGGLLLSAFLGPYAAFLVMASVLTVQALFFADGGLLALGCNIWNMGVYPCFLVYPLIFRPLAGRGMKPGRLLAAALLSAVIALQLGAVSVVLQTLLSGKTELPFPTFLWLMLPAHFAIGIVEGLLTAGVIQAIRRVRPDLFQSPAPAPSLTLTFLALAVLTGGVLSWFASTRPDALEHATAVILGQAPPSALPSRLDTSMTGLLGGSLVLGLVLLIGVVLRKARLRGGGA